jgi:hypothetical protein
MDASRSSCSGNDFRYLVMFLGEIKGIIDFSGLPEAVKQNSKLPGNSNYGSLFSVLASTFCELQAPATQIAVGTEGTQDILGRGDKQTTQIGIARLGDTQLGIVIAGLIASGDEADGRTDLPAPAEAIGLFKREDEGQGSEWTHTPDPAEQLCLWVAFAAKLFDLLVIGFDLLGEGSDGVEDEGQSRSKGLRDIRSDFVSEAFCCARGQTRARGFDDIAGMVDE